MLLLSRLTLAAKHERSPGRWNLYSHVLYSDGSAPVLQLLQKNETQGSAYHLKRVMLGGLVDHYSMIKRSHRFVFIACGTSYHASLACRQTVEELAELPVSPFCPRIP